MSTKRKRSIRWRLTRVIMLTSATAVLLACIGLQLDELRYERERTSQDFAMLAGLIASSSEAPLSFADPKAAEDVLRSLHTHPSIIAGCIYTASGTPFATYKISKSIGLPRGLSKDGLYELPDRVELFYPISLDGERIGTLYIAANRAALSARMTQYMLFAASVFLVSLLTAFLIASRVQRSFTRPIVRLSLVAREVSEHKNFSVRVSDASLLYDDEISNCSATSPT
jgi:hypothetical protein